MTFLWGSAAVAQEKNTPQDLGLKPIFVTTRIFQLRVKDGGNQDLTDQIFKMRSSSLSEYEKWVSAIKKAYPGSEVALLKTESRRVFRVSKPSVISLAKGSDGRHLEMMLNGAQSPGDGVTPGTSLIPEINLHESGGRPVTYSMLHLEVESGMTYFYAITNLKINSADYAKFFRPGHPADAFKGDNYFLVCAFSVDLDKTAEPPRYFDERQSLQLQEKATRKVQPEVPAALQNAGIGGFVRVRVEISPDGKVAGADIQYSSFPEINHEALAAARRWEFPATLFDENKNPITAFMAFSFAVKPVAPSQTPKATSPAPPMR
jgi:TonB family protein